MASSLRLSGVKATTPAPADSCRKTLSSANSWRLAFSSSVASASGFVVLSSKGDCRRRFGSISCDRRATAVFEKDEAIEEITEDNAQQFSCVMKFGGSSLASAVRMKEVADLILSFPGERPVIVLSAMGKTTNKLLQAGEKAVSCGVSNVSEIDELSEIRDLHFKTADELGVERSAISGHLVELEQLLNGIAMMKELTLRTRDYLVSFGECMSTRILAAYMNKIGAKARQIHAVEDGNVYRILGRAYATDPDGVAKDPSAGDHYLAVLEKWRRSGDPNPPNLAVLEKLQIDGKSDPICLSPLQHLSKSSSPMPTLFVLNLSDLFLPLAVSSAPQQIRTDPSNSSDLMAVLSDDVLDPPPWPPPSSPKPTIDIANFAFDFDRDLPYFLHVHAILNLGKKTFWDRRAVRGPQVMSVGIAIFVEHVTMDVDQFRNVVLIFVCHLEDEYDAFDMGFITTDDFTNADILEATYPAVAKRLIGDWSNDPAIPIVTGFLGKGWKSCAVTTLGRGGSDLTATTIGKALGLREIQVWKDVDGVLTCDPNIYPRAKPVPFLTFDEAAELAYFGAQVLHPQSMRPAREGDIPVRAVLTSIVLKRNVTMLDIVSTRMLGQFGFLAKVFSIFEDLGISVDVVATSEVSISLTLDPSKLWSRELIQQASELDHVVEELEKIAVVNLLQNRSIISLIGNVQRSSLILEKAFNVMRTNGVNVQMISQGASKVNISLIVNDSEAEQCVRALHHTFFEQGLLSELESEGALKNGYTISNSSMP
ncbi:hypothetical protein Sjap_016645 [Stephania japonica]|uniref:aspartate kinase n=1 Tax=Stephania japonica TaxID=461633 RepID=A0AAP0NSL0_9MAGN